MKKIALTKEIAKELSDLRTEIFAQTKKYNKLSNKYSSKKERDWYEGDEDFASNFNIIVVFEKNGNDMVSIEPSDAEYWVSSSFCG